MNSIHPPVQKFASQDDVREARPFYLVVMAVLAGMYILALNQSVALRAPERLVLFTLLMLLHAVLHWNSPRVVGNLRAGIIYLAVQGVIFFLLPLIANGNYLVLGLSLALVGEAVGILWNVAWIAAAIVFYLGLAAADLLLLEGNEPFPDWAIAAVPMTFFVVLYVVMYSRQAQARTRAQELLADLETAHRQLAEYATRVEDLTLANERQRMARELHDTLAQGLAGLVLQLEAANNHLANGRTERTQAILQEAMSRARATLADARRAIDDLRADQTAPRDFAQALGDEVSRFTDATGIPCALELSLPSAVPDELRGHALRAVSEGLTNIARHAQAQRAWVNVRHAGEKLAIELRDDGCGFDPAEVPAGHYGLVGMRERARLASGTLEVTSAPGKGTTLKLLLPLRVQPS